MADRTRLSLLPRSVFSSLHEPMHDPKDGHGALSRLDIMVLQKWKAAKEGDDDELVDLLKIIIREDLTMLKAARKERQQETIGGGSVKLRSLIPVMNLLSMIIVEKVAVPLESDGYREVTERKKIMFEPWFAAHAFERPGIDATSVEEVIGWLTSGGIHRPHRGEWF